MNGWFLSRCTAMKTKMVKSLSRIKKAVLFWMDLLFIRVRWVMSVYECFLENIIYIVLQLWRVTITL